MKFIFNNIEPSISNTLSFPRVMPTKFTNEIFYILFFEPNLQDGVCISYAPSTCHCGPATFQGHESHLCLMTTVLEKLLHEVPGQIPTFPAVGHVAYTHAEKDGVLLVPSISHPSSPNQILLEGNEIISIIPLQELEKGPG